jgi:hypothetical protein
MKERLLKLENTTGCKVFCSLDSINDLQKSTPRTENLICRYYDCNESTGNNNLKTKILLDKHEGNATSLFNNLYEYNPNISLSSRGSPIPYIVNAIERILQGEIFHTTYKYIRTNKLNANDIKELNIPNSSSIFSNYTHFGEIHSNLLQILRVSEECGVIASLGALKLFVKPKKLYYQLLTNKINKLNVIEKQIFKNGQSLCNLSGLLNPDKGIKNGEKKKVYADEIFREEQIKIQNTSEDAIIIKDSNLIKKNVDQLKLINNGPFINQDFYDADYLISCSLLDVFIVLVAQLNTDICNLTAKNFLKNYSQTVKNNKNLENKNEINNIFAMNNIKEDEEDIELDINSFDIYSNLSFGSNCKIIIPRLFSINKSYLIFRESISHAVIFQIFQLYSSRMFDATISLGSSGIYDSILRSINDDDSDGININKNPNSIDCLSNNTYNFVRPSVLSLQSAIYDACVSIQESITSQDLKTYMENEIRLNESNIIHQTTLVPLEKIIEDNNVINNKTSARNKLISNDSYLIPKDRQMKCNITLNNYDSNTPSKKRNLSKESTTTTSKHIKISNEKTKENLSMEILYKINKMIVFLYKFPEKEEMFFEQCCTSEEFSFLVNKTELPYLTLQKELDNFKSTINLPLELHICKIPTSITDNDMSIILSEFGTINYWNRDKSYADNQLIKNFGVVQFESSLSALKCLLILDKIEYSTESEKIIVNIGNNQKDILNLFSVELRKNIIREELKEISEKISFIYRKINERNNYDPVSIPKEEHLPKIVNTITNKETTEIDLDVRNFLFNFSLSKYIHPESLFNSVAKFKDDEKGFEASSTAIIRSESCNYEKSESICEKSLPVNDDEMTTDLDNTIKSCDISNNQLRVAKEATEFLLSLKFQLISSKLIAFLKLWSFFDVQSGSNGTTGTNLGNNKYQLLTNWSCISFGKSKPILEGVSFVFNLFNDGINNDSMNMSEMLIKSKSNSSFNDSIEINPCSLSGNLNTIEINQILSGFKDGNCNLLFAVDNGGLEINSVKSSDVIINFDTPNPSKTYFLR